jgi:hypothetical protein
VRRGKLYSLTAGEQEWLPTATVDARCDDPGERVPHQAPAIDCHCGAHAVDSLPTLDRVVDYVLGYRANWPGARRDIVLGAVQCWGAPGRPLLVEELRGKPGLQFRAPHMRIVALARSPQAERVARSAGIAVIAREHLESVAREWAGVQLRPPAPAARRPAASIEFPDWARDPMPVLTALLSGLGWVLANIAVPVLRFTAGLVLAALGGLFARAKPWLGWLLSRWWTWAVVVVVLAMQPVSGFAIPSRVTAPVLVQLAVHGAVQWLRLLLFPAGIVGGVVLFVAGGLQRIGVGRSSR